MFKLNTVLNPTSFNTYDSYGECLLKTGDLKNAVIAYEKVLEVNPSHNRARSELVKLKE